MYIVIGGGALIGKSLTERLMKYKHDVVVIDRNKEICDKLYAETGVIVVNGWMSHIETLIEAGIEKADVAISNTDNDADNLAFSLLSKSFSVPNIITRMENPEYEKSFHIAGVNTILQVTDLLVDRMIVKIHYPGAHRLTSLGDSNAYIYKLQIPKKAFIVGKSVEEIVKHKEISTGFLFLGRREAESKKFQILKGHSIINADDELYYVVNSNDDEVIMKHLLKE